MILNQMRNLKLLGFEDLNIHQGTGIIDTKRRIQLRTTNPWTIVIKDSTTLLAFSEVKNLSLQLSKW